MLRSRVGVVSLQVCGRQTGTRKEYRYGWVPGLAYSVETVFSAELEIRAQELRSGSCKGRLESYARVSEYSIDLFKLWCLSRRVTQELRQQLLTFRSIGAHIGLPTDQIGLISAQDAQLIRQYYQDVDKAVEKAFGNHSG